MVIWRVCVSRQCLCLCVPWLGTNKADISSHIMFDRCFYLLFFVFFSLSSFTLCLLTSFSFLLFDFLSFHFLLAFPFLSFPFLPHPPHPILFMTCTHTHTHTRTHTHTDTHTDKHKPSHTHTCCWDCNVFINFPDRVPCRQGESVPVFLSASI